MIPEQESVKQNEAVARRAFEVPKQNCLRIAGNVRAVIGVVALAFGLLVEPSYGELVISYNEVETFDAPVPLAETQEVDKWFPDRYRSAAFESFALSGQQVLRVAVVPADGAQLRPPAYLSAFYNTQGRKLDLPAATTAISAKLFFPASWQGENTRRRSDVWTTAIDEDSLITSYPIIGIVNLDGTPVIRYWDGSGPGEWVNTSITPVADTWYRFEILLEGSELVYYVNGVQVGRFGSNGSTSLRDVMFQSYNFNDTALAAELQSADPYDAYWDDFSIDFELHEATRKPDLTVGSRNALPSHNGAGVYGRNPNRQQVASTVKLRSTAQFYVGLTNAGNSAGEIALESIGRSDRRIDTRIFESGSDRSNVTAKVRQGRYTKSLEVGESTVYRVVKRLKAQGKLAGRRVVAKTIFQSQADGEKDTVSVTAIFRR